MAEAAYHKVTKVATSRIPYFFWYGIGPPGLAEAARQAEPQARQERPLAGIGLSDTLEAKGPAGRGGQEDVHHLDPPQFRQQWAGAVPEPGAGHSRRPFCL
jgi:hypothetical protein